MKMLKKIAVLAISLGCTFQVQAFEKNQLDLKRDFWGTWSVYNAQNKCTETYQFTKPAQVTYTAKQKKMTGDFAIITNSNPQLLHLLVMDIKTDNKKLGCDTQVKDYTNGKVNLSLKWISAKTAELCLDRNGKQCTGLYMIKQK